MKKIGVAVLTFVIGLLIGPVAVVPVCVLLLIPWWPRWTTYPIYGLIVGLIVFGLAILAFRWLGLNRYVALVLLAGCVALMVWIEDVAGIVATVVGILLALSATARVEVTAWVERLRWKFTLAISQPF